MARKRKPSKRKKIRSHFWVFCEGKTEEAYVRFLRSKYRILIEIVPKIVGSNIDERFIRNYKKGKPIHEKDIDFLMYDANVKEVLDRLRKVRTATLLVSNPSIELWFLMHYKNQTANITTHECVRELSNRNRNKYKKGIIDKKLSEKLDNKKIDACKRARKLKIYDNPSSNIYKLITILENIKKEENKYN